MLYKSLFTASFIIFLFVLTISCGKKEYISSPGTPSYTVETLLMAIEDEDVDLYLSVLPSKIRAGAKQAQTMMGDKFEDMMKQQISANSGNMKGAYVSGETIDGDKAKVTISDSSGNTVTIQCIKEPDGWVLNVGK